MNAAGAPAAKWSGTFLRAIVASPRNLRSKQGILLVVALLLVAVVLIRTAWICDDAYITYRTIDNFLHGFGLRWNVAERVQSFTHPLWLILLTPFIALTGEPYYTSLVVSILLTLATVALICVRVSVTPQNALLAAAEVGRQQVTPDIGRDGTLKLYLLKLPAGVERLDTLEITARRGDFRYSLGHLRVI